MNFLKPPQKNDLFPKRSDRIIAVYSNEKRPLYRPDGLLTIKSPEEQPMHKICFFRIFVGFQRFKRRVFIFQSPANVFDGNIL